MTSLPSSLANGETEAWRGVEARSGKRALTPKSAASTPIVSAGRYLKHQSPIGKLRPRDGKGCEGTLRRLGPRSAGLGWLGLGGGEPQRKA